MMYVYMYIVYECMYYAGHTHCVMLRNVVISITSCSRSVPCHVCACVSRIASRMNIHQELDEYLAV